MDTVNQDTSTATSPQGIFRGSIPELSKSPVHLLSSIVALGTDKLWDVLLLDMAKNMVVPDKLRFLLLAGLLLLLFTAASVALTQRCVEKDELGMSLAKGLALGILSGVPYSFGTTELGLIFIGWSGINELQKMNK